MLKLKLFGSFHSSLHNHDLEISFRTNKIRALLAYLVLHPKEIHSREIIATLLWGNMEDSAARKNLRLAFYRLRQAIDKAAGEPISVTLFESTSQTIRINPAAVDQLWCDVSQFSQLMAECDQHVHDDLHFSHTYLHKLKEAVALYQGDFLEGLTVEDSPSFEDWQWMAREQYRQQVQNGIDTLIESYQRQQRFDLVRDYCQRALALEPWRESAHRQLMLALANGGHRAAALAQYEKCRVILQEELAADPSAETESLMQKIKSGADLSQPSSRPKFSAEPNGKIPSNLPVRMTSIFGRANAIQKVVRLLDEPNRKLITLLGEGGIGKSRLSLEVGERLRNGFHHGVWFVPLAGVSGQGNTEALEERIATAICESLSIPLQGKTAPVERLFGRIKDEQRLIILDNFEHIIDGAGLLIQLLEQSPKLKLLVSSRQRLGFMAETIFPLAPLSLPVKGLADIEAWEQNPAVALFLERAERVTGYSFRGNLEVQEQITELCHLVQGIPLALELTAAALHQLSLDELLDSVQESYTAVATSFRDFPDRHRSLRAVFNSSWQQLTEEERLTFARCSVFRGGFDTDSVFAIIDRSAQHIRALSEKSLITLGENGRYTIHELVRQFAAEKLSPDETAEIEAIHSNYYLNFVAHRHAALVGPRPQDPVAEITADLDNIRWAWQKSLETDSPNTLAATVEPLSIYYEIRGYYREASKTFGDGAAQVEKLNQPHTLVLWLRAHQMRAKVRLAEYEEATAELNALIPQADSAEEPNIGCTLRISLAEILWRQGQYSEATGLLNEVIDIARQANLPEMETSAHYHIGTLCIFTGDQEVSSKNLQEAQAYWRNKQNHRRLAQALNNLGLLYIYSFEYESAEEILEEAFAVNQEIEDAHANVNILNNLGLIAQEQGKMKKSRQYWRQLLETHATTGEIYLFSVTLLNIGHSYIHENRFERASEYLKEATSLIGDKYPILNARTLFYFGLIEKKKNNYAAALQKFEQGREIALELNDAVLTTQIEKHQNELNQFDSTLTNAHFDSVDSGSIMQKGGSHD